MPDVKVTRLNKQFGDNTVLDDVDFTIRDGEFFTLLGPSGCGKSTTLNCIAGLEEPTSGAIAVGDTTFVDTSRRIFVPPEGRNLGMVFQSYALWPHKTVADNVAYGLKLRKVSADESRQRVATALANLGLGQLGERLPHQLSGGQQQRVAIARALVYNPPVILMDEPLSNLDAKLREEARAWLRELILKMKLSALVVTHDQNEAMAMSDRILLLNNGVIEQQGTPQEMYGHPATLFAADFMGSNNRIEGHVAETRDGMALLAGDGWRLWGERKGAAAGGASDARATGMVRLECVRVTDAAGDNRVKLPLVTSMYLGDRWEHLFHLGDMRLRAYGNAPLPAGEHWLEIPRDNLWIF
jgi:iron(III) transport system ATP-binding protein